MVENAKDMNDKVQMDDGEVLEQDEQDDMVKEEGGKVLVKDDKELEMDEDYHKVDLKMFCIGVLSSDWGRDHQQISACFS